MNETVTLPQLITRLATAAGCSPAEARRYIHDLFAEIEQALAEGKNYTLEGIGEFAPGLDATHPVLFRADPAFAKQLNEPFESFPAVELPAEITEDLLDSKEEPAPAPEPDPLPEAAPEPEKSLETLKSSESSEGSEDSESSEAPESSENSESSEDSESSEASEISESSEYSEYFESSESSENFESSENSESSEDSAPQFAPAPAPEPRPTPEPPVTDEHLSVSRQHSTGLLITCGIMIGLVIGLILGYFAGTRMGRYYIEPEEMEEDSTEIVIDQPADIASQDALPSRDTIKTASHAAEVTPPTPAPEVALPAPTAKEPVYDNITQTQFLTTLARKHYGVKNYWIFIYEANPDLGDPNKIRPGTRLLIPDRSTFEEATPEATAEKARQHLNRLSAKYKF